MEFDDVIGDAGSRRAARANSMGFFTPHGCQTHVIFDFPSPDLLGTPRTTGILTLFSPSGARGSVIHEPKRDPEVLIVIGSLIPVSLPQAEKECKAGEHHSQQCLGTCFLMLGLSLPDPIAPHPSTPRSCVVI